MNSKPVAPVTQVGKQTAKLIATKLPPATGPKPARTPPSGKGI